MSALNVWVDRDYVLAGADTLSTDKGTGGDPKEGAQKIFAMPCGPALLAWRGDQLFGSCAAIIFTAAAGDFDSVREQADSLLGDARALTARWASLAGAPYAPGRQEVAFVGWSTAEKRFAASTYEIEAGCIREHRFSSHDERRCICLPWDRDYAALEAFGMPRTPQAMLRLLKEQVLIGEPAVGGHAVLALLRPDGITLTQAGRL